MALLVHCNAAPGLPAHSLYVPGVSLPVHRSRAKQLHKERNPFQCDTFTGADGSHHGANETEPQFESSIEHRLALLISWCSFLWTEIKTTRRLQT